MDYKSKLTELLAYIAAEIYENETRDISATETKAILDDLADLATEAFKGGVRQAKYIHTQQIVLDNIVHGGLVGTNDIVLGDIVLLTGQDDPAENGLWEAQSTGVPVRPLHYDSAESQNGLISVRDGGTLTLYKSANDDGDITIAEFTGGSGAIVHAELLDADTVCDDALFLQYAGRDAVNGDVFVNLYQGRNHTFVRVAGAWTDLGYLHGSRALDPDGVADYYGDTIQLVAGVAMAFGDVAYIDADGKAQFPTQSIEKVASVMAVETIEAEATGKFLVHGVVKDTDWVFGEGPVWVSDSGTTGNTLEQVTTFDLEKIYQIVGVAVNANTIIFRPSFTWIEIQPGN